MKVKKFGGIILAVAIIACGASFWGGMAYAQSKRLSFGNGQFASQFGGSGGNGQRGLRGAGMNAAFGKIIKKDTNSITVELGGPNASSTNGSATGTKLILVDASTEIAKTVNGSTDDLAVGENVVANGTPNSDGSITAQMIQIRPAMLR